MNNKFCFNKKYIYLVIILFSISFFSVIYKVNSSSLTYKTKASPPQIIGGQPADPGEWPFAVVLYDTRIFNRLFFDINTDKYKVGTLKDAFYCTGFLISDEYILTAAHCLYEQIRDPIELFIYKKRVIADIGVAVGYHNTNTTGVISSKTLK